MNTGRWEFWIDVGGTFTDLIARRPDGTLLRHKVLSSGVTKGVAAAGSTSAAVVDPARAADPEQFWIGYTLRLLGAGGEPLAAEKVVDFERSSGTLRLEHPLKAATIDGASYELSSREDAPLLAIRYLLARRLDEPLPSVSVRLGTTRGTNALITRRGARTAFVTTAGFGDVLRIGYQNRPRLFDLAIRKHEPLFAAVVEIDERVTASGEVLLAPDEDEVRRKLEALKRQGIESLAICLLHAFVFDSHERIVAEVAREVGFEEVSTSSRVAPLMKIVSRGDTTVVDAYLNPVLRRYVQGLRRALGDSDLRIMTSAGGLVDAESFVGKDSILSGPAGGVVGVARVARAAGFERAIGFDMGGTSTDVSRFDGRYEMQYETEKAGVRVVAPMLAIETVAAGGGSICGFDGVKLVVGPDSAGADPGPACYGRGGPLAVTDANFFLGRILACNFPFPLDRAAVETRLEARRDEIARATGRRYELVELCEGYLKVANANMVKAIRSVSVAKGCDPRQYLLVAFGGAAPQHACAVARELGIRQVLNHPDAGVLSAYGLGMAEIARHRAAGVYRRLDEGALAELAPVFAQLADEARAEVLAEGVPPDQIDIRRSLDLRYESLDAYLNVREPARGAYSDAYEAEHRKLYGYHYAGRPVEIVAARVDAVSQSMRQDLLSRPVETPRAKRPRPTPQDELTAFFDGLAYSTRVFARRALAPGDLIAGPAIVAEELSTTVIEPGWEAEVLSGGELLLADLGAPAAETVSTEVDAVMLEIFNNRFASIAEQMGITLRNTSSSVNVKERLDFSCALFTAAGELVVNAPHIPVHLGAMGETVRRTIADNPQIRPGDVYVTNDPYRGGSHLPDVTVVTPVHDATSGRLLFFTANRAHHAEIGGIAPGSMPPFSRRLAEEGVLIRNFKLVDAGRSQFDELRALLLTGPYPTRAIADNLADVAAQVAANQQGARELGGLVDRYGLPVVLAYMGHIRQAAERKMRAALRRIGDGRRRFVDHLDDGTPIAVSFEIDGDRATIDFTGTGPVLDGNLNANRAIVTAAVMYCLRCLIDEDIPLNEGVLAPIELIVPECLLNPREGATPRESPAVVGGNVETSQRVVDALLGALGAAAASQGTMNNLIFGDAAFGYYETICGGSGATATADGADAVHTHMTNTRLTDPEVLEHRYPVRVLEFSIRRGSGGRGARRGGDGVIRRLEFTRPLQVAVLAQRRGPYPPYGLKGGEHGAFGRDTFRRVDGTVEVLTGQASFAVAPGDVLTIETPGGGAYGQRA